MFMRAKRQRGKTYWQVVEAYRDGGRVRHRTLYSLGCHETREAAQKEWDEAAARGDTAESRRERREAEVWAAHRARMDAIWGPVSLEDCVAAAQRAERAERESRDAEERLRQASDEVARATAACEREKTRILDALAEKRRKEAEEGMGMFAALRSRP